MFTEFMDATARFMKNGPARLFAPARVVRRLIARVASAQTAAFAQQAQQNVEANNDTGSAVTLQEVRIDIASNDVLGGEDLSSSKVHFEMASNPSNGVVRLTDKKGTATYGSNAGFTGTDTFTYRLIVYQDTNNTIVLGSDTATVTVTVSEPADTPTPVPPTPTNTPSTHAVDDNVTVITDTAKTFNVLSNDVYNRSVYTPISLLVSNIPANGTATALTGANLGKVRYTPDTGFTGQDQFRYSVRIRNNNTQNTLDLSAIVRITVADATSTPTVTLTPRPTSTPRPGEHTATPTPTPEPGAHTATSTPTATAGAHTATPTPTATPGDMSVAPALTATAASASEITLTWGAISGADSYELWRYRGGAWTRIGAR